MARETAEIRRGKDQATADKILQQLSHTDGVDMTLRTKKCLVALMYHGGVVLTGMIGSLLGIATSSQEITLLFSAVLFLHLLTFRLNPLGRLIQEKTIQEAECPGCSYVIDLVDSWKCHCGFNLREPRHAFSPCPNCGRVFGWIDCPYCDTSIPV